MSKSPSREEAPARRTGAIAAGAVVIALIVGAGAYYFWPSGTSEIDTAAVMQTGTGDQQTADLMKPDALPDIALGAENAPVTIVEYSSLTCPHCAHFHNDIFPKLKAQYIDTGKVRYIVRQFPLDNVAAAAAMLARCIDKDRYYPFINALYEQQQNWAYAEGDPTPRLQEMAKQAGFSAESFKECLSNQKLLDKINEVRARAAQKFGVNSTPTFFVNGKLLKGAQTLEEFESLMPPDVVKKAG